MTLQRVRRIVALTVVFTLLCMGIVRPRPARAVDTAVLVLGSIAAYVAFVSVGTLLTRRYTATSMELMEPPPRDDQQEPGVRFAPHCRQNSPNLKLICW
ncbi:MAG TPA: hypothetical protein VMW56_03480 [Candidatus Margulisiibacteriota bacterium]|nr:hypothetical protein [Candidatus Margulisiibacteriota bacterium]